MSNNKKDLNELTNLLKWQIDMGANAMIEEKNDFFSNNEVVFYKNIDDLSYKINKYKKDVTQRKKIAKKGKKFYFKYFNSTLVADYIVKKTLNIKNTKSYLWEK